MFDEPLNQSCLKTNKSSSLSIFVSYVRDKNRHETATGFLMEIILIRGTSRTSTAKFLSSVMIIFSIIILR